MANLDYQLNPDDLHTYLCNIHDGDNASWEQIIARSPIQAALQFYNRLTPYTSNTPVVYVLLPGENPGVDTPQSFSTIGW